MAQTREIRERIGSIKSTLKITNAMYMISSTKLNNARASLAKTEPYFYTLQAMLLRLLRHLPDDFHHPYLDKREAVNEADLRRAIICVTADKGLAGAYNHNVIKMAMDRLRPDSNDMLYVVGEVGRQYFMRHNVNVDGEFLYTAQQPTLQRARLISEQMLELFAENRVDEVYIIYTRMKTSMESVAKVTQLLPLVRLNQDVFTVGAQMVHQENFNMEPSPKVLLDNIIPDFVRGYVYSALVESFAAEHSARMQAMDAANKSGQELVQELGIRYNRERQAQITQEITEIAAGARARKEQTERARKRREAARQRASEGKA